LLAVIAEAVGESELEMVDRVIVMEDEIRVVAGN
jgi:hypothetical protein